MIRIYVANVESYPTDFVEEKMKQLQEIRRKKIQSLKKEEDRYRSLVAGFLLKDALKECGVDYENACFKEDEQGKPYMEGEDSIHFNLSHAENYVAVAVADHPIGVDVESISHLGKEPLTMVNRLSKRVLSETEKEVFQKIEEGEKVQEFCRIWTGKEAYTKWNGKGIRMDFRSFSTSSDEFFWKKLSDKVWLAAYPVGEEPLEVIKKSPFSDSCEKKGKMLK